MKIDPTRTAAFTGHRTYDGSCDEALRLAVRQFYADGYRLFLTGMAAGFDLSAGEQVAALKSELADLQLCCVIPFDGHSKSFHGSLRRRYEALLAAADEVVVLASGYHAGAYHARNDYLVDNASALIAYCDGTPGGTKYTVRRAQCSGLRIENLWQGLFSC